MFPSGDAHALRRPLAALVAIAILAAAPREALADDDLGRRDPDPQRGPLHPVTGDDDPRDEFETSPLVTRHDKHWARASLELGAVVVLGFVDYLLNTAARGGVVREGDERWSLRYDWQDLRGKLIGTAYELDANRFATNYVSHPFAGAAYYQVARSNHLSFAESFLASAAASTVWEYFGEIRERVSVNDMLVTPVAGAVLGEATVRMSSFFSRGQRHPAKDVLAFLFAPIKVINDWTDGAEEIRTGAPWHRFESTMGLAATRQEGGRGYADVRVDVDLRLASLPGYRGAARHARLFDDGNLSRLGFRGALSGGELVDAALGASVVPLGIYRRVARIDEAGRLVGEGSVVGLRLGFEYGVHDFDRDRRRPPDQISVVSPLGLSVEHVFDRGALSIKTSFEVGGGIAGVRPYALADHRAVRRAEDGLPTATRNNGYYHAFAISAAPALEATYGPLVASAGMRLDSFHAIEGIGGAGSPATTIDDRRALARASLGCVLRDPLRVTLFAERAERQGAMGDIHASRSEVSLGASLGAVF